MVPHALPEVDIELCLFFFLFPFFGRWCACDFFFVPAADDVEPQKTVQCPKLGLGIGIVQVPAFGSCCKGFRVSVFQLRVPGALGSEVKSHLLNLGLERPDVQKKKHKGTGAQKTKKKSTSGETGEGDNF